MIDKTATNLFMRSSLTAGLYQQIATSVVSFTELGNRLITYAKQAQSFRQYDRVEEAARVLSNIPLEQYQLAGRYYLGLCDYRKNLNPDSARRLFEQVADCASTEYRFHAIASLAAIEARSQDYQSELYYTLEALKVVPDITAITHALKAVAIIKAKEGFHSFAIKDLENILPFVSHAEPLVYFDFLNSYAVELNEVGRKDEARNVINRVLASPYASAYPEWLQTAEDLKQANRSFVAIKTSPVHTGKLLNMPVVEQAEPTKLGRPAQVINLEQWKKKMAKDDTPNDRTPNEELNDRELTLRIFQLVSTGERTGAELFEILNAVEQVLAEHKK